MSRSSAGLPQFVVARRALAPAGTVSECLCSADTRVTSTAGSRTMVLPTVPVQPGSAVDWGERVPAVVEAARTAA